ncbi:hypothetical protein FNB15_13490 [Ferrovibrio terrae]|uniref:Uncharacterized protein n=1 Tax=Ferrovibrio terrae TaxID=2594003 RepID=A0A516H3P7_9PROT|nr:hypothetical protein [Ferrovibrio terrae]QDO98220.1 hypothetical protein FNB15_13490 [Ferrovibrio terrae]
MSNISLSAYRNWIPTFDPNQSKSLSYTKWEDRSPEDRAESIKARADVVATFKRWVEVDRQMAADAKGHESHYRGAPNVNNLTREQALYQIEYMSELIQSGEAEKTALSAAKGTQTTSNYRQYVYWVQQHLEALDSEGAGQCTLAQA